MSERAGDSRVHIRLMNEYGGGLPLWPDDIDLDIAKLDLSDLIVSDLLAFSDRWDPSIDPEVTDDRWDGVPIMRSLVSARYSLGRRLRPARQRLLAAEDEEMRQIGEDLRVRLEQELGPGYRVTYLHG